jgi:hypothetical protein
VYRQDELLRNDDAFGTTLLVLTADRLGPEMLEWDPETIRMEIDDSFDSRISDICFNKLMAAVFLATSNGFYRSVTDFVRICNALSTGSIASFSDDPADMEEVCWGILEAGIVEPPADNAPLFDVTITEYIRERLRHEGFLGVPRILEGVLEIPSSRMPQDLSEDPALFQAVQQMQNTKQEKLHQVISEKLQALLQQLSGLRLRNGDARDIVLVRRYLEQLRR